MHRIWLVILLSLLFTGLNGQVKYEGVVIDRQTGYPLPFVHVIAGSSGTGTTTDIDGRFRLIAPDTTTLLTFSFMGYEKVKLPVSGDSAGMKVVMRPLAFDLEEVVISARANPAHRIIRNVMANRKQNNPMNLPGFRYKAYDKLIFSIDLDSLPHLDTVAIDTGQQFRRFLEKHHLFIMESVSRRDYSGPGKDRQVVEAQRTAGFNSPSILFLIPQMQEIHFYDDQVNIAGEGFVNPVSPASLSRYRYYLTDTLIKDSNDTLYSIRFEPANPERFAGLKGHLAVNTDGWAIEYVIAEPAKPKTNLTFRVEQKYEKLFDSVWFPVQINNQLILRSVRVNDTVLEVGLSAGGGQEESYRIPFGTGRKYLREIEINPDFPKGTFGNVAIDLLPDATRQDESFWRNYRTDSLSEKDIRTYQFLDSLGRAEHFDRQLQAMESMVTGKIMWGGIDLVLSRFLTYNDYEGFAPGIGLSTNERLSKVLGLGGFVRYGFRDKKWKGGADLSLLLWNPSSLTLHASWMDDVAEFAGLRFRDESNSVFQPEQFRLLLVNNMDRVRRYEAGLSFRFTRHARLYSGLRSEQRQVNGSYQYRIEEGETALLLQNYRTTEWITELRFAWGEKWVRNGYRLISLGTRYPVLKIQYHRGMAGLLSGEYEYIKAEVSITKKVHANYFGTTSITMLAGIADRGLPASYLYSGRGAYRPFTIYAPQAFATMRMNEFLSDRYASLFITHDFGHLAGEAGWFHPAFAIASNLTVGSLKNPEIHQGYNFKTLEKGYYESGLLINDLLDLQLYTFGIGAFYRYGPYAYPAFHDNLAMKFTLNVRLGRSM